MSPGKKKSQKIICWSVFIAVSIAISFWLSPVPEPLLSLKEKDNIPWQIPSLERKNHLDTAYQTVIQQQPWGKEKMDSQNSLSETWQLSGVVRVSDKRFALIKIGDKTERYKAGDTLPHGEVLQAVHDDSIHVRTEGDGVRVVRLYQ